MLQVGAGARRHVLDHQFLRHAAAQGHADVIHELVVGHVVVVRFGTGHGIARRVAAGDNGHLVHGIAVFAKAGQHRMPRFVVGSAALVGLGDDAALFLRAHQYFIDAVVQFEIADKLLSVSRG